MQPGRRVTGSRTAGIGGPSSDDLRLPSWRPGGGVAARGAAAAAGAARLAVADQHGHGDAPRRRQRSQVESALLAGLLQLVAVVLEPDLHLRRRQAQDAGEVLALRRRQVALLAEAALQLERLRLREENAALLLACTSGRRSTSGRRRGSGLAGRQRPAVAAVVARRVGELVAAVRRRRRHLGDVVTRTGSDVVVVVAVVDGTAAVGEPVRRRWRVVVSTGPGGVAVVDLTERCEMRKSRVERRGLSTASCRTHESSM